MQVERAFEHHGQDVGGAAGLGLAGFEHLGQAVGVVVFQLLDAFVQAGERLAVGRQHQRVGGQGQVLVQ